MPRGNELPLSGRPPSRLVSSITDLSPLAAAMVSVCATCKGLQNHLHGLKGAPDSGAASLVWLSTRLPRLRASASSCRACALLVNGILLHRARLARLGQDEDDDAVRVTAESFKPRPDTSLQGHLSVELRWTTADDQNDCQDDDHDHAASQPDLKLEFFTDGGMHHHHAPPQTRPHPPPRLAASETCTLTPAQKDRRPSLPLEEDGN